MSIGEKIRRAREARDWSQQQLADVYGALIGERVDKMQVSRWETGGRNPSPATVYVLEQALGRSLREVG